jgi:hypothetical protein
LWGLATTLATDHHTMLAICALIGSMPATPARNPSMRAPWLLGHQHQLLHGRPAACRLARHRAEHPAPQRQGRRLVALPLAAVLHGALHALQERAGGVLRGILGTCAQPQRVGAGTHTQHRHTRRRHAHTHVRTTRSWRCSWCMQWPQRPQSSTPAVLPTRAHTTLQASRPAAHLCRAMPTGWRAPLGCGGARRRAVAADRVPPAPAAPAARP